MNNLKDKNIVIGVPIEVDAACNQFRERLSVLPWISKPYLLANRFIDIDATTKKQFYYPETFAPTTDKIGYKRLTPDSSETGLCFFVVSGGKIGTYRHNKPNFLTYNVGIVFSVNLELIDKEKLQSGLFTRLLMRDARKVLRETQLHVEFDYKITGETNILNEVYKEYTLNSLEKYNRAPLQSFRFDLEVTVKEDCNYTVEYNSYCGHLDNFVSFNITNESNFIKTFTFEGGNTNGNTEFIIQNENSLLPIEIVITSGFRQFNAGFNYGRHTIQWRKKCENLDETPYETSEFEIVNEGLFSVRLATVEPFNDNDVQFPVYVADITTAQGEADTKINSNQIANNETEFMSIFNSLNGDIGTMQNAEYLTFTSISYWKFDIVMNDYKSRPSQAWAYEV